MTQIIGIGGKLASGKDTVADYLVEHHGWVKIGMSDGLAEALYVLDPYIPQYDRERLTFGRKPTLQGRTRFPRFFKIRYTLYAQYHAFVDAVGYVKAKENTEVRRLLQKLGTEVGRKMFGDNIWVDMMVKNVQEQMVGVPGVIVTGIRYPNEVEAIRNTLGGELWWVDRTMKNGDNADHSSENSVGPEDFDRVIENNSSLARLYDEIEDMIDF